jgi:hypothetical protein
MRERARYFRLFGGGRKYRGLGGGETVIRTPEPLSQIRMLPSKRRCTYIYPRLDLNGQIIGCSQCRYPYRENLVELICPYCRSVSQDELENPVEKDCDRLPRLDVCGIAASASRLKARSIFVSCALTTSHVARLALISRSISTALSKRSNESESNHGPAMFEYQDGWRVHCHDDALLTHVLVRSVCRGNRRMDLARDSVRRQDSVVRGHKTQT